MFCSIYNNKKILITGHTGFKGSWLSFWLMKLGADIVGYSLRPNTVPSHYKLLDLDIKSEIGDIRNRENLEDIIKKNKPDIIFHLAAQPLVRLSYSIPLETLYTNIIGTANLLDVCRKVDSVKALVNVTSDKCYNNKEWVWGYRENDEMGGYDPYSVSKGCSELITSSFRSSFFNINDYKKKHNTLVASCRAGNVIGGGDWAIDRLIPDIMTATALGTPIDIRNPHSIRPWQHVLEPLSGYLMVGQKLLEGKKEYAESWNFGPGDQGNITVGKVAESLIKHWDKIKLKFNSDIDAPHEACLLKLDCSKANYKLKWRSVWNAEETLKRTAKWYKTFYEDNFVNTASDLDKYIEDSQNQELEWIK